MRIFSATTTATLLALSATAALAQSSKGPAIRPLGNVTATSSDSITMLGGVRHLPNGNLLVNDLIRRRVVMLDPSLKLVSVIADTMPGSPNPYGTRPGSLVPYKGDSTLFIDASSLSMLVIDGAGNIARVMSVPRSQDAGMLASTALGGMGFDGERMVYRGNAALQMRSTGPANPGSASASGPTFAAPTMPDTLPIVRVNLATRALDTVAYIKVSQPKTNINRGEDGNMSVSIEINPLPVVDDYAVMSDGRIAIVRGRDYHVEFIDATGKSTVGPKIPFEWKRLTDEEKVAFIDSVKAQTERAAASGGSAAARVGTALGAAMGGGAPMVINQTLTRVGGSASGEPIRRGDAGNSTTFRMAATPNVSYIEPSKLPDYQPAFFGNQVRGDMDGNIWVRINPTKPIAGGPLYDVINGKGELIDRVQIPADRTIVGFGAGGVVYMSYMDGAQLKIERASFK